jgi:hypothetical protein
MGERIGRIGRIRTDFFELYSQKSSKKSKQNPFESARSAQSVLPLYHTLFCHVLRIQIQKKRVGISPTRPNEA